MTSEATIILVIKLTITSRNMILNFLWIIINKIASVLWTWLQGFNHLQLTSDTNLQTFSQCQPQNSFKTTHKPTNLQIIFYIFCVYMMTSEATIILVIKLTITSRNMILNFLWIIINKIASVLWTWLQGFNHLQLTSDTNLQTFSQCQPQNSFKTTHKPTNYILQLMNSLFFSVTFLPLIVCRDKNSQNEEFVHCICKIL